VAESCCVTGVKSTGGKSKWEVAQRVGFLLLSDHERAHIWRDECCVWVWAQKVKMRVHCHKRVWLKRRTVLWSPYHLNDTFFLKALAKCVFFECDIYAFASSTLFLSMHTCFRVRSHTQWKNQKGLFLSLLSSYCLWLAVFDFLKQYTISSCRIDKLHCITCSGLLMIIRDDHCSWLCSRYFYIMGKNCIYEPVSVSLWILALSLVSL